MKSLRGEKEELDRKEASGLIRATRFVNNFAQKNEPITADIILEIHLLIFKSAQPAIAGQLRQCEFRKLHYLTPPSAAKVPELFHIFSRELPKKLGELERQIKNKDDEERISLIMKVAAWCHYQIVSVHPFADGNGRTARLALELVLKRFDLPPATITSDSPDRQMYLDALKQIDVMGDYEPFLTVMGQQMLEYLDKLEKKKLDYNKTKHRDR